MVLEKCAQDMVSFNKTNLSLVHHVIICLCNDFPTIKGQFISNMSVVIADPNNSPIARQAAGLQLKNCLTVKDLTLKKECQQRWSKLEEETRMAVRERLISTLGTENIHPSCAAQCLAYIAVAELFPGTQPSSEMTSWRICFLSFATWSFNQQMNIEKRQP